MPFPPIATFCALLCGLSIVFLVIIPDSLHAVLLASLLALTMLPWFLWRLQPDPFAPVYLTSIVLSLAYPVRMFMFLLFPDFVVTYFPLPYDPELVTKALLYTIMGIGFYLLIYYNPPSFLRAPFKKIALQSPIDSWPLKILVVYSVGWAFRLYQLRTQNYAYFRVGEGYDIASFTLLTYLGELAVIAYILVWVYAIKESGKTSVPWLLVIPLTFIEATYAITMSGSKFEIVRRAIYVLMAYSIIKKRLLAKLWIPTAALVVLFVFPFVQAYRVLHIELLGEHARISALEGLAISPDAIALMYSGIGPYSAAVSSDSPFWLMGVIIFLNRFAGIDALATVLTFVPEQIGYVFGKDLLDIPFTLIPRALWPDKPLSDVAEIFDREMTDSDEFTSTSPYPIAEGYFNGGLIGILVVMSFLALLQQILYAKFFASRRDNALAIVAYIWFFIWVTMIDTWVLSMSVSLLQKAAIFTLVYLFMLPLRRWLAQPNAFRRSSTPI